MVCTVDNLMNFLKMASDKHLMKYNTARTRRTAIRQVFSIVPNWEEIEINSVIIDEMLLKFKHFKGADLKTSSFNTYTSRIKNSYAEYIDWKAKGDEHFFNQKTNFEKECSLLAPIKIPLPNRFKMVVTVEGLPSDLRGDEAAMIATIITAYAKGDRN